MKDTSRPNNLFELLQWLDRQGIPKDEYWQHIRPFWESKSRRLHIPIHGVFELTPLCNFDCKMCYVHLNAQQYDSNRLLSVRQWKKLADDAYLHGMRYLALTGGECLTYPGFDELYISLITSGIRVHVMSNGYLMNKERIAMFKQYTPDTIQISIYGCTEDTYEAVTGVRAFRRVYDNILNIRDAGLPIRLAITPNTYMKNDIEALIDLAEKLHLRYGVNPQLKIPRQETGRSKEDLSMDEYLNIYRYLSKIHHEKLVPVDIDKVPDTGHDEEQRHGIRCGAGRSSFGIKYDGKMCPCLSLDTITVRPLEIGFEEAWKQINIAAEEYSIPNECGNCIYRKHCLSCVAIHKGAPVSGHCDPIVCERMKRLVQEGFVPLNSIC